ncbi:Exodeoxyribonuclease VII large subunit [Rhizobiales bacterium GAS113]|nr:Exodeoxyribonuclease VII large subunit [Rhizobiales bacterium GAS113]
MPDPVPSNVVEWSVSELSGALKRTLEGAFGHVRVRGEISGYRGPHSSGHSYFSLKDQNARLEAVIWKTTFNRLAFRPEEGLEVIATGRITTFPGSSKYQIVIESLEPAGVGALMALLEERRRKLAAEGLFDEARKKPLPYLPRRIGVITSPTGAVIRDILHRLSDRFPRHVLLWPVRVQGDSCAAEVAAAIAGFNALPEDGPIPRPDLLIVARGGGSLEDLWGFNEEIVVRAAAASAIPLISAVGHETDWTLIDHVADRRAPTPTGAAEIAVPVRVELSANLASLAGRMTSGELRHLERKRSELRNSARALPSRDRLIAVPRQRLDAAVQALGRSLERQIERRRNLLAQLSRKMASRSPAAMLATARQRLKEAARQLPLRKAALLADKRKQLAHAGRQLATVFGGVLRRHRDANMLALAQLASLGARQRQRITELLAARRARLEGLGKLLDSVSYRRVLARGYALVHDAAGHPLRLAAEIAAGQALVLEFADGKVGAVAEGGGAPDAKVTRRRSRRSSDADEPSLFE